MAKQVPIPKMTDGRPRPAPTPPSSATARPSGSAPASTATSASGTVRKSKPGRVDVYAPTPSFSHRPPRSPASRTKSGPRPRGAGSLSAWSRSGFGSWINLVLVERIRNFTQVCYYYVKQISPVRRFDPVNRAGLMSGCLFEYLGLIRLSQSWCGELYEE